MDKQAMVELVGTQWQGSAELWLDPMGDNADRSDCTLAVEDGVLRYTWSHEGKEHQGSITLNEQGAAFTDSWHQPVPMQCRALPDAPGLFQVQGSYGPQADWGWRIGLFVRTPTGELVLQMTNITPWGEEARAVRMAGKRQ